MSRFDRRKSRIAVAAVCAVLLFVDRASAQPVPPNPNPGRGYALEPPIPLRVWGLGTVIGGGYGDVLGISQCKSIRDGAAPCMTTLLAPAPYFLFPTLEVRVFTRNGDSINLSIPVVDSMVKGFAGGLGSFAADVFYNFNFGRGIVRFFVGPGIGFNMTAGIPVDDNQRISTGSLRLTGLVGVEFVTPDHHFGFQIRMRPWMQGTFGSIGSAPANGFGGGVFGEVVFMGYGTRMSR